jgi:hypothetical protein
MEDVSLEHWKEARRLIDKGWTQGTLARDHGNRSVPPLSHNATCWCVEGAFARSIHHVSKLLVPSDRFANRLDYQMRYVFHTYLNQLGLNATDSSFNFSSAVFNDTKGRTKEEVLNVLDKIIENNGAMP